MPTYAPTGATTHASGVLVHKLTGAARAKAHVDLMGLIGAKEQSAVAELARLDPSLLIEPIPQFNPVTGKEFEGWRIAWQKHTRWLGLVAGRESETFPEAIEVMLTAGIHPDDRGSFVHDALLGFSQWRTRPALLRLALAHGAATELPPECGSDRRRSVLRPVLSELGSRLPRGSLEGGAQRLADVIECAEILLAAGAIAADAPQRFKNNGALVHGDGNPMLFPLMNKWFESLQPWVAPRLEAITRSMHAAGAKLDMRCGNKEAPLILEAVRDGNMFVAMLFVQMGARTDDAFIARPFGSPGGQLYGLIEEAQRYGGADCAAQMTQAMMRQRLATVSAPAAAINADAAPVPTRRRSRPL